MATSARRLRARDLPGLISIAIPPAAAIVSVAIIGFSVVGFIALDFRERTACSLALFGLLAVSERANLRRKQSLVGMASVIAALLLARNLLQTWSASPFVDRASVVHALLSVVVFLAIGGVGCAFVERSLRGSDDRKAVLIASAATIVGYWSLLAYTTLSPGTRNDLSGEATALVVASFVVTSGAMARWYLTRRHLSQSRAELAIGLGALTYFLGDALGILGDFWHITAHLRIGICGLLAVGIMAERSVDRHQALGPRLTLRPQNRETALVWILLPAALGVVPLLAWVANDAEARDSWFRMLWTGGSLFVVIGLATVLIAGRSSVIRSEPRVPEPAERCLHYQPIVRSIDQTIIGAEALFRVVEQKGTRSGGWMFTELKDSPQLAELTDWVTEEAFRGGQRILRAIEDPDSFVSFNLSSEEFASPSMLDRIDLALAAAGCTADGFMIEVTEHDVLPNTDAVRQRVHALQERGFLVALDDFGSGYASLQVIADIDFDLVKIDRSLVVAAEQPRGERILHRTIDLLAEAGLLVLAEGIEDERQSLVVRRRNPHFVQGYATGAPMPIADLLTRVDQQVEMRAEPQTIV